MLVFDATPLIYLATADRLDLLAALPEDGVIPPAVYDEVVTAGVEAGQPDARRVERVVEDGILSVMTTLESGLGDRLRKNPNLSAADVAVIALAGAEDSVAVMDERYGRSTADTEGVETRGTVSILVSLVQERELSADEAVAVVDEMIDAGWYCSTDLYTRIVRALHALDPE